MHLGVHRGGNPRDLGLALVSAITTKTVGVNVGQLWPGQNGAEDVQVINLDDTNTAYLGSSTSIDAGQPNAFPLGPLASAVFPGDAPLYGVASVPVTVGLVPGGSNYSPGSLTISGPVTADITGPVDIGTMPDVTIGSVADVNLTSQSVNINTLAQQASALLQTTAAVAAGVTGGPFSQAMPGYATGYAVEVVPVTTGSGVFWAADVVVAQYDAAGQQLTTEVFTVTNYPLSVSAGIDTAVVRGPLVGTTIQVTMLNATAGFLNTLMGISSTVPQIKAKVYALAYIPPAGSGIVDPFDDKVLCPSEATPVSGSYTYLPLKPYAGLACMNIQNAGTSSQTMQVAISSYSVATGPASAITEFWSDFVAGQSAVTTTFAVDNYLNVVGLVQRAGGSGYNAQVGITALS